MADHANGLMNNDSAHVDVDVDVDIDIAGDGFEEDAAAAADDDDDDDVVDSYHQGTETAT
jgi:hypothetical protein